MIDTQRVALSSKLVVEHNTGSLLRDLSDGDVHQLEVLVREGVRLDAASKAIDRMKEANKQAIAAMLGDNVPYIHYHGEKRNWKLRIYVNYFLVASLVQKKLVAHKDIATKWVKEGLVMAFIYPVTKKTQKMTQMAAEDANDKIGGRIQYVKSELTPFVLEKELIADCKGQKVSLAGTQGSRVTLYVEEEAIR